MIWPPSDWIWAIVLFFFLLFLPVHQMLREEAASCVAQGRAVLPPHLALCLFLMILSLEVRASNLQGAFESKLTGCSNKRCALKISLDSNGEPKKRPLYPLVSIRLN